MLFVLPALVSCSQHRALAPDLARIDDASVWVIRNGESHASIEEGRTVVRLAPIGGDRPGSNVAIALAFGVEMTEGTIDVDLRAQGNEGRSFLGVAFGVTGESAHEAVYFRPFNFHAEGPSRRAHSVQYVAWPEHTWEALRTRAPGTYEAAVDPAPDPAGWFHARVDVTATDVRVFVDDAKQPCLVVSRLGHSRGRVGLWVDSQEASFRDLKIRVLH